MKEFYYRLTYLCKIAKHPVSNVLALTHRRVAIPKPNCRHCGGVVLIFEEFC